VTIHSSYTPDVLLISLHIYICWFDQLCNTVHLFRPRWREAEAELLRHFIYSITTKLRNHYSQHRLYQNPSLVTLRWFSDSSILTTDFIKIHFNIALPSSSLFYKSPLSKILYACFFPTTEFIITAFVTFLRIPREKFGVIRYSTRRHTWKAAPVAYILTSKYEDVSNSFWTDSVTK
jgi:hypothetical protein